VVRLICFPYAGGGASVYRDLPRLLPGVDVRAVELPGRGARWREPACDSMERLVDGLLEELAGWFDVPFCFLGHSMGAAIAFELTERLSGAARSNLRHLFVSARGPAGSEHKLLGLHKLEDGAFKRELHRLNGTPMEIFASEELMQIVMPMLRADFTLIERYCPSADKHTTVNITAFAGARDAIVPVSSVAAWREVTSGSFELHVMGGGDHFFLSGSLPRIAGVIAARLEESLRR
jgi:medium-chain acyl-[acyl-carrier-protein] hydrolase